MIKGNNSGNHLRFTRIPVEYKAVYTMGDIQGEGILVDISEDGVALRVKQVFMAGDVLRIESNISSNLTLEFTGEVKNVNGNIMGIQITEIDPEIKERFKAHIEGMLRLVNKTRFEKYDLGRLKKNVERYNRRQK